MDTITITLERYNELLRKEFGFEYRKNELTNSSYVSNDDSFIFGVPKKTISTANVRSEGEE